MPIKQEFTLSFIISPYRYYEFASAWTSLYARIRPLPKDIILFFNPYHEDYFQLFQADPAIRRCTLICHQRFHNIARCWNQSICHSDTKYVLILNDDIIFDNPNLFELLKAKHEEGFKIVHATENWSATSVDKTIISEIGWFDESFVHSAEDIDYRFRMERAGLKDYRFEPHLIRHLRSNTGRSYVDGCSADNPWDLSMKHLFDKWGIADFVQQGLKQPIDLSTPEARRQFQATGFFRRVDSSELTEVIPTPNYYPEVMKKIANEN